MTSEENNKFETEEIPEETGEPVFDDDPDMIADAIPDDEDSASVETEHTETVSENPGKKDVYSAADHVEEHTHEKVEIKEQYSVETATLATRALSEYYSEIKDENKNVKFDVLFVLVMASDFMFECNYYKKKYFELSGNDRHQKNEEYIFHECQRMIDEDIWKFSIISDECRNAPEWVVEVLRIAYQITKGPSVSSVVRLNEFDLARYMDRPIPCSPDGDPNLFELTDNIMKEQGAQEKLLFNFIHNHIVDMDVHQLTNIYEQYGEYCADHKGDYFYKQPKYHDGYGNGLGTIFENLRDDIFKYIFEEAQSALEARVKYCQDRYEMLARNLFLYRIPVPHWLEDCMNIYSDDFRELNAQILWAWIYAVQNVPEEYKDLFTEDSKEIYVCSHLCDILPELKKFYARRYKTFWTKYDNEDRPHIFTDQTESYKSFRKHIHLPQDFNTYPDYGGDV